MLITGGSRLVSRSACSTTARWTLQCSFSGIRRARPLKPRIHGSDDNDEPIRTKEEFQFDCHSAQPITWYPGHIAKAERELAEYLKKVDVVIEVRDARIPISTTHPMVPKWVGNKPLIVVIARIDQISRRALDNWRQYYTDNPVHESRPEAKVFFIDGKLGAGIVPLKRETLKAGVALNERYHLCSDMIYLQRHVH
jgi:ribosome biogenesis GTPase A